jgi:hypothetical protein
LSGDTHSERKEARACLRAAGVPDLIKTGFSSASEELDVARRSFILATASILTQFMQFALDNAVVLAHKELSGDQEIRRCKGTMGTSVHVARGIRIALVQFSETLRALEAVILGKSLCYLDADTVQIWLQHVPAIREMPFNPSEMATFILNRVFDGFLQDSTSGSDSDATGDDAEGDEAEGDEDAHEEAEMGADTGGMEDEHWSDTMSSHDDSEHDSEDSMDALTEDQREHIIADMYARLVADEARFAEHVSTTSFEQTMERLALMMESRGA